MSFEKGFYKKEGVPKEEIERLKNIDFPSHASLELLKEVDLQGRKLLDIGAGSNSKLGEYVESEGGKYVAMDLRMEMLKNIEYQFEQKNLNFYGIQANAKDLPFLDESVDFIHQRFVLMHLSPEDQKRTIEEILRITKNKSFLVEYDWSTLSSQENEEALDKFKDLSFEMMSKFKIDPLMGGKLEGLLKEVDQNLDVDIKRFSREEADYTNELIDLCAISSKMAMNVLKDEALAEKFDTLKEELDKNHIKFTPPDIVGAIIKK